MTDKAWTTTALDSNRTDPARPRTELDILKAARQSFATHPRRTPQQQQAEMPKEKPLAGGWMNPDLQQ